VKFPPYPVAHAPNKRSLHGALPGPRQSAVLNIAGEQAATAEIATWPGYAPTPLIGLGKIAAGCGLDRVWYKDEAGRFGLGSFKALGGAYAVLRLIQRQLAQGDGTETVGSVDLITGRYGEKTAAITVTCATDGNHGRSVAWGAQQFGCNCVIYLHAAVSQGREDAIAHYGAKIVRVAGNYDDSVRQAARDAGENGWFVVSDTSYPGYMDIPRDVMQGYTVMVAEAISQLPDGERPTHTFIQGGVGGLAAAVADQLWEVYGTERPRVVVVEPENAACLYQSVRAGEPVTVHGDLDTIMAGLACGEVSLLAWEILDEGADDFLTVPDAAAIDCMRLMADGEAAGFPIVAGESAVAGLAGLILAADDPSLARGLGLGPDSRVLLFGSEGATDRGIYTELVGRSPEDVMKAP